MPTPDADAALHALQRENERLRRAVNELSTLNELATDIGTARDLDEVIHTIVQRSLRAVGAEQGVVTLVDEANADSMKTLIRTTMDSGTYTAFRLDESLLGWMQIHKTSLLINDPHHDERFSYTKWDPSIRSVLSVPLMTQSKLIGVLTLFNKHDEAGFQFTDQRLLSIIAAQSAKVVENARLHDERNQILQLFGQHTSPAIAEALLRAGPDTATSRRQHVCVMFLDIRGFMTFSEQHAPEEVVDYLNRLFEFMSNLVNRYHGIIHQLLGDGFMAIFGAPLSHGNDSQNAVKAALAIIDRVRAACTAGALPPTRVGIGLHAGEVVAGTVGSVIHKEYKVTGDVVNLSARIEQLTKRYDAQLLVSKAVWKALEPGQFEGASIGAVDVRGRAGSVHLYKLA